MAVELAYPPPERLSALAAAFAGQKITVGAFVYVVPNVIVTVPPPALSALVSVIVPATSLPETLALVTPTPSSAAAPMVLVVMKCFASRKPAVSNLAISESVCGVVPVAPATALLNIIGPLAALPVARPPASRGLRPLC